MPDRNKFCRIPIFCDETRPRLINNKNWSENKTKPKVSSFTSTRYIPIKCALWIHVTVHPCTLCPANSCAIFFCFPIVHICTFFQLPRTWIYVLMILSSVWPYQAITYLYNIHFVTKCRISWVRFFNHHLVETLKNWRWWYKGPGSALL